MTFNLEGTILADAYKKEVECLCNLGREWNMSDQEINKIIEDSIDYFNDKKKKRRSCLQFISRTNILRILAISICIFLLLCTLFAYKKSVQNIVERNVQEMIYPGMKLFRKLMLPFIKTFPSLTEWYDENCLVRNPYFQVSDLDCWPCSNVRSVLNFTGSDLSLNQYHSGLPFIFKEKQINHVGFAELQEMYLNNKAMFDEHSPRIEVKGSGLWRSVEEFLLVKSIISNQSKKKDSHITWKLTRLEPMRAARHLFGFPQQIPHYVAGAVPEKFILVDEPHSSPYLLPTTEGSTVFIIQGSGTRLIVLDPAPECKTDCHRVSLVLQAQHILWYNWWYWQASSFPLLESEDISIMYVGSFY